MCLQPILVHQNHTGNLQPAFTVYKSKHPFLKTTVSSFLTTLSNAALKVCVCSTQPHSLKALFNIILTSMSAFQCLFSSYFQINTLYTLLSAYMCATCLTQNILIIFSEKHYYQNTCISPKMSSSAANITKYQFQTRYLHSPCSSQLKIPITVVTECHCHHHHNYYNHSHPSRTTTNLYVNYMNFVLKDTVLPIFHVYLGDNYTHHSTNGNININVTEHRLLTLGSVKWEIV